jgi:hypothetical protein
VAGVGPSAHAQKGVGAAYGARDPIICESTRTKGSTPTVAEATRFFTCANESESPRWGLKLVADVKLQMAGARRYNPANDMNVPQIDTGAPMFDLRGSFTQYSCDKVGGQGTGLSPAGKNCNKFTYSHATGTCYKTTFGDWRCQMMDMTVGDPGQVEVRHLPPPK